MLVGAPPHIEQQSVVGIDHAEVAINLRVRRQHRRADCVRHGDLPVVPGAVGVVHAPDMALGEVLVLRGNLVQAFPAQCHFRQRLAQLAMQRQAALEEVQPVDEPVLVIVNAQRLVQVERVRAVLRDHFCHALDERLPPRAAGRVEVSELDGRFRRPFPPLQLPG